MTDLGFDYRAGDTVAGRYTIIRPIGLGGSAAVYRARHVGNEQKVALKVMHETDPSGVGKQRFEREAALVQKLQHPNIVKLHDYGHTEAGQPYIAFALLEGRSLKYCIKHEAPFDERRICRLTLEVLSALDVAHRMGIVHRDIKPANVFLCRTESSETAQVLDFGLAKALFGDEAELLETLTKTGFRLGTPRYMSPEMARGQHSGEPGDLYALGLVMAEMIVGTPVVAGTSQIEVLMAHGSEGPIPLPKSVLDSPFGTIIQRAVSKQLDVRYRTAMQMSADVAAVLSRLDAGAGPTNPGEDELAATLHIGEQHVAQLEAIQAFAQQPASPPPAPPNLEATVLEPQTLQLPVPTTVPEVVVPPAPRVHAPAQVERSNRTTLFVVLFFLVLALAAGIAGYLLG